MRASYYLTVTTVATLPAQAPISSLFSVGVSEYIRDSFFELSVGTSFVNGTLFVQRDRYVSFLSQDFNIPFFIRSLSFRLSNQARRLPSVSSLSKPKYLGLGRMAFIENSMIFRQLLVEFHMISPDILSYLLS
ncbi:hypothetical protein TWF225_012086 [Orbilia oligospora]|uniref:Uncharacterized protein n=1 Tax=Orbilia oligospora TaxID=2813651 RepID=A0A7C8PEB0_ORBOL|nr:hypothetical protein TWF751_003274 [Orbilia oligospora]KAF3161702.1 hypothetical protein TWF225_012086 [Orbilia oligospora]KAF3238072.1 hypothetical protein TWF128_012072 [Orbilia oligospora]KAF3267280.1 hypothetical protein TWF217_012067 [Orbilia oligospora]KAF3283613.1 hypothetical protein TWF132_010061 [Orbilia oligospora]